MWHWRDQKVRGRPPSWWQEDSSQKTPAHSSDSESLTTPSPCLPSPFYCVGCTWVRLLEVLAAANAPEGSTVVPLTETQKDAAFDAVKRYVKSGQLWVLTNPHHLTGLEEEPEKDENKRVEMEKKAMAKLKPLAVGDTKLGCV